MPVPTVTIDGAVANPRELTFDDLQAIQTAGQIEDVAAWDSSRSGRAVTLAALLERTEVAPAARYLTLHASRDDFHASIPLDAVRDRSCLIYARDGQPLPAERGGPFRFFIRDHAACQTDAVDDCANVKFVDRIELSIEPGFDNRPQDDAEHEALHRQQSGS